MVERSHLSENELTTLECEETNKSLLNTKFEDPLQWLIDTHPEMLQNELSKTLNAA